MATIPMGSYISGGCLVGVPNVIFHKNAVQAVVAVPKPTPGNHPPCSVRDDLSHTKASVFEMLAIRFSLALMRVLPTRYRTGSGSGWVTGGAFSGDFGGGMTGSCVGDTGASRGITVYLLMGSPIRATADLPR